ncbi:RHS repeat domain-containing protein [Flavobacterium anhuiense]|uniref:RHS repeat domain-containing protein n=1 Tax=Flavobacterium anhuiense TaxID=459526 RepID=UPI0034D95A42
MKRYLYILLYIIGFFNFTIGYSQETSKPATTQRIIEPTDPDCEEYEKFGWFYDNDGDGAGDPNYSQMACTRPSVKWVSNNNDCDDNNPNITYYVWYYDKDHDGFGDPNYPSYGCNPPADYVDNNLDCNDNNKDINPYTKWYLDTNGDGIGSDLDGSPIISCTKPAGDYLNQGSDNTAHWIHQISYDTKGNLTGTSRTYFNDLGKSDVSLSKDYVTNKIWGTETTYDDFGRVDKTSFIAPSPLNTFGKTNFLKSSSEVASSSSPPTLSLNNITSGGTYKALQSITVTGAVSSGLNVSLTAPTITLSSSNNFIITATPGSSFVVTAANLPDVSANPSLANYYSDNNTDELYQATATHPFAQTNYDNLNPGNVINVVGGNKINGEWKTGYSYNVPAAQEMYYVYGSDYYDGAISGGREEVITKFYKSVSVDANGNENVAFTDGEGKLLATARSGGSTAYPVVSLIGTQGYVDVHIPAGITSGISLIGGAGLYKIYDLKTGLITSGLTGGNAYRIEAITPPTSDPKTYIAGGQPTYDSGALGITYNVNYYDYAVNVYNKTGQLIKVIQPNGYSSNTTIVASPSHMTSANFATTYKYNGLNQLIEVSNPDEGISKFAYRNDGQIRYSQSALQTDSKVSYTDYDELGRPKESGVMTGNSGIWSIASTNPDGDLIAGTRSEQVFTIYDYPENNATSVALPTTPNNLTLAGVLANVGISSTNYTQNNLSGNVAVTFTKPGSTITAITWYSYDLYGRAEWIVQYNEGIGAKTIHYEYDYKGNIKKVLFQKDKTAELFVHRYTYNVNDALTKVETSTDNTTFTTHADYSYYKTGELKRVNIAQGTQGLDYVYTLGGQLKSINHPSLESSKDPGGDANDVFGLTLDYYNGDYLRTGRNITSSPSAGSDYNGNIKAARWANKGVAGDYNGSSANQKGYLYNYNRNNWLTSATFGNTNSSTATISPIAGLAEGGLTYDPNGNIQSLQRTNEAGTIVDKLTYNYTNTGKNQLNSITENAAVTADVNDIENQSPGNYVYDAIGQLKQNVSENLYYFYNTQGLVTEVKKGANTLVKFFYNERGQRIKKESYNTSTSALQNTTFYQLDLSGNTLAVYNLPSGGSITQIELPIYGLNRLGIYKKASGIASYEIKDHLGNVRAVIEKESGSPVIKSFADYYPFGEQLPSRNALSNYRYAFQGQELDQETGMEAFQLRLWDGRIGRWLSTDPYREYQSPYVGMGNNPISLIDPNGGCTICPGNAKNGQTFNHPDEGLLTYKEFKNGGEWLTADGGIYMDDVTIIKTGFWAEPGIDQSDFFNNGLSGFGFGANSKYANFDVRGFGYNFGDYSSNTHGDLRAEVYGLKGSAKIKIGNDNFGESVSARGTLFSAKANIQGGFKGGRAGEYGISNGAEAGVYVAEGEVSGSSTLFGATFSGTIGGSVVSAHIGGHGYLIFNDRKGTVEFSGLEHIGFGIGEKVAFSGSIPIRTWKNYFFN